LTAYDQQLAAAEQRERDRLTEIQRKAADNEARARAYAMRGRVQDMHRPGAAL
jgi:hypothetical protein